MSATREINADVYRQMMDLQEKLRQSEAERVRLEEMFSVLIKTFKEEQDSRLKNLESRYHSFLEDCARRSNRNEKILRSIERVESGANVLYAKTERLKLLRNHYEAYLERVIPAWKHHSPVRYGKGQLPYPQEIEWNLRNHLIPVDILDESQAPSALSSRPERLCESNLSIPVEYYPYKYPEIEKQRKPISEQKCIFSKNFKNIGNKNRDLRDRIYGDGKDEYPEKDFSIQTTALKNDILRRQDYLDNKVSEDTISVKKLKSPLQRNAPLSNKWISAKTILHEEGILDGMPAQMVEQGTTIQERVIPRGDTAIRKEEVNDYIKSKPMITREPIEIKKPEYIVGKFHPHATSKLECFNKAAEQTPEENVKNDNPSSNLNKQESVKLDPEITKVGPGARWTLLKHLKTIDKLKERLDVDEGHDDRLIKSLELVVKAPFENDVTVKLEETDVPQSVSEGWNNEVQEEQRTDLQSNFPPNDGADMAKSEQLADSEFGYQTEPQEQGGLFDSNEVYEDNEETYPESYYEQPPKPDYSRDIVSNVILEEDESEVNMNEDVQGGSDQQPMQRGLHHTKFETTLEKDEYDAFNASNSGELINENRYQNPGEIPYESEIYGQNYEMQAQGEYMYDNPEINNYPESNELEYNAGQLYQSENVKNSQYYETQESQVGFDPETMVQSEAYENQYEQSENCERNADQYNESMGYKQEYTQGQEYYDTSDYNTDYFQNQMQQGSAYQGSEQPPNVENSESAGSENAQPGEIPYCEGNDVLPLRQSNLTQLLESDTESFQMEHGSAMGNEDSDFDFSLSQQH